MLQYNGNLMCPGTLVLHCSTIPNVMYQLKLLLWCNMIVLFDTAVYQWATNTRGYHVLYVYVMNLVHLALSLLLYILLALVWFAHQTLNIVILSLSSPFIIFPILVLLSNCLYLYHHHFSSLCCKQIAILFDHRHCIIINTVNQLHCFMITVVHTLSNSLLVLYYYYFYMIVICIHHPSCFYHTLILSWLLLSGYTFRCHQFISNIINFHHNYSHIDY